MGLSRYLSKLSAALNSSGQLTAAGLAVGATGTIAWVAANNSAGASAWVKLCTVSGNANDRGTIFLSGVLGYSSANDDAAGGATLHYTIGNDANVNNLNLNVVNTSNIGTTVTGAYAVKGATDYIWDIWVQIGVYTRLNAIAFGNIYTITNTYTDVTQSTKPTGGYDKKVGRLVTSLTPGAILQVVQGTKTNITTSSSTSYADFGLSASITPSSATSKILVQCSFLHSTRTSTSAGQNNMTAFTLFRDGVNVHGSGSSIAFFEAQNTDAGGNTFWEETNGASITWLDSPAKTTSTTYGLYGKTDNTGNTVYVNSRAYGSPAGVSTILLLEVAA